MTDSPWTPGPWTVEPAEPPDIEFPWWIAAHHVTAAVAEVLTARDARLIAAAPEMAELLAQWLQATEQEGTQTALDTRALLSRIRGEA